MPSFTLKVRFSGLCLFVRDRGAVTVLLPDARKVKDVDPVQADGTRGDHHIAYLGFDLANLDGQSSRSQKPDDPTFQGIYRLERESVDFGLPTPKNSTQDSIKWDRKYLVKFEEIAPPLTLIDGLVDKRTPPPVLGARIILRGGMLRANKGRLPWVFSKQLSKKNVSGCFSGTSDWTRRLPGEGLTITIRPLRAPQARGRTITLQPDRAGEVHVKIGNLPATNPLEWPQLESHHDMHRMDEQGDVHFKWLYRLFRPKSGGRLEKLLNGYELPHPEYQRDAKCAGDEPCINAGFR